MDFDDLGAKFWWKFAGVMLLGAVALFICMLVFSRIVIEWGFLGLLLVMCGIGLLAGWWRDRREPATDTEVD